MARPLCFGAASLALFMLAACESSVKVGPQAVAGLTPDGTIDMQEVQVAFLASSGGGNGTLYYRGAAYPFTIGGLGVGGVGASTISASGEVYKLNSILQRRRSLAAQQFRSDHAPAGEA
jgi:hypothetical protein